MKTTIYSFVSVRYSIIFLYIYVCVDLSTSIWNILYYAPVQDGQFVFCFF